MNWSRIPKRQPENCKQTVRTSQKRCNILGKLRGADEQIAAFDVDLDERLRKIEAATSSTVGTRARVANFSQATKDWDSIAKPSTPLRKFPILSSVQDITRDQEDRDRFAIKNAAKNYKTAIVDFSKESQKTMANEVALASIRQRMDSAAASYTENVNEYALGQKEKLKTDARTSENIFSR